MYNMIVCVFNDRQQTVRQWYSSTVRQWYSSTVRQWYSGTVVQ